jgi:hypothetical protein
MWSEPKSLRVLPVITASINILIEIVSTLYMKDPIFKSRTHVLACR